MAVPSHSFLCHGCVWERDSWPIYDFLPNPSSPPQPIYQNTGAAGEEMKEHLWHLPHGFSTDVSLWDGSWESWRGSELPYQNLQHWMSQREDSLAQEVGRQGPHRSSVSLTHCYLSRTWFCNRPTLTHFVHREGKHTEHLLDGTLSYVNNCP